MLKYLFSQVQQLFAEKLETLVSRAEENSRMKDFLDIYKMINSDKLDLTKLTNTIEQTFTRRKTEFSIPLDIDSSSDFLNKKWNIFQKRQKINTHQTLSLKEIIVGINTFFKKRNKFKKVSHSSN
ncbi:MAG: nucleotidyl transferase AbiEii/AbiGii toxin family protein [Oligoflexia bacterium]|nr:nucleotidyl transferase AbiEii/AbiGii toxin family protein [Oligoflexia bacterium]